MNKSIPEPLKPSEVFSNLRLLHLCRALPAHETGGMQTHAWDLTRTLAGRGHEISILTTALQSRSTEDHRVMNEGIACTFLGGTRPMRYSEEFWRATSKVLIEINCNERQDLVHSQSAACFGLVRDGLVKRLKLPLVVTLHGTVRGEIRSRLAGASLTNPRVWAWAQWSRVRLMWVAHFRDRVYIPAANKVICVSQPLAEQAINEYGLDPDKVAVIPNGVNIDEFRPGEPDKALMSDLGIDLDLPVILFLGRVEIEKGPKVLLRAWAELCPHPPAQLLIVGKGSALEVLRRNVRRQGLEKVIIAGFIPSRQLAACYRLADIFCFPTLRREGLPLNVLEAMASGLPVVVSPIGGIPMVVDDNVGRLVGPEPSALAINLKELLADEDLRRTLGRAGRERIIAHHSLKNMADATLRVYQEVLDAV